MTLSAEDREVWAPGPSTRTGVPVLLYHRPSAEAFARQMALLDHAGYETITLDELVRFVKRQAVSLPPRPMLVTFDGGRLDSWTTSDGTLRELGFNAVLFVDVGPRGSGRPCVSDLAGARRVYSAAAAGTSSCSPAPAIA